MRPKPMPGQESGGDRASGTPRRPHAAPPRRGKRLTTLLFAVFVGTVLVLSGIGLGTVGATVIGMSKLADLQRQAGGGAGAAGPSGPLVPPASGRPGASVSGGPQSMGAKSAQGDSSATAVLAPGKATLGVEAVDAASKGALVVGVHAPVRATRRAWSAATSCSPSAEPVSTRPPISPGRWQAHAPARQSH
ncbi:hypothetical protein SAV14893_013400 [Streptomyces avermitilis]|uniref:Uncharacterized protein n=1 Tax=Streptomyces avermitilis TaxID=33903 RepID=A0A4D4LUZ5_STRAX|nr:hypothetical protein SAV14893_013400 [Streptomyces avermitilis]